MRYRLRTKLSLSYVFVILICVAIISIASNFVLEKQFRQYVMDQQEQKADETVSMIEQRYRAVKDWDTIYLENIGMNALENGMIIKVVDAGNNVIWDATVHNNGMCQQMLTNMSENMQSRYSEWEGGYEEKHYVIGDGLNKVGTVSVGYYGPFYYTDSDLYFINSINSILVWAGIASITAALILGVIISNQLSKPISRVIDSAQMIAKGLYGKKVHEKSNTDEIRRLVDTINDLGETLKKQQAVSKQASLDIAHELRTPLTTVQGNLEAVMDGVMELDSNRIEVLYDEVLRLNRLVDDLGRLSRFERESLVLNKTKFDISALIRRLIQNVQNDFTKEDKVIRFKAQKHEVVADIDKISQVMLNLISNALKFTKPGGVVDIGVYENSDEIEIIVKDNGIGILEKDLPHIFDRFYRADRARNSQNGGVGVGLTIVQSIIKAHNGRIIVNSIKDKRTEFIINLPKEKENAG